MAGKQTNSDPKSRRDTPGFIVDQESWARGFFSRMKSYLSERPAKVPNTAPRGNVFTTVVGTGFGGDFVENLKDFFRSSPQARRPVNSTMLVETPPWYKLFWQNLRDTVAPPKLPPLKVTSKPVKVREIWSKNEQFQKTQAISLTVHALLVMLLIRSICDGSMPKYCCGVMPHICLTSWPELMGLGATVPPDCIPRVRRRMSMMLLPPWPKAAGALADISAGAARLPPRQGCPWSRPASGPA